MHYRWTEKGTDSNKDYHFIMWPEEEYDDVVVRCTYGNGSIGSYSTQEIFSKGEDGLIYDELDRMKERLYEWSHNLR